MKIKIRANKLISILVDENGGFNVLWMLLIILLAVFADSCARLS